MKRNNWKRQQKIENCQQKIEKVNKNDIVN